MAKALTTRTVETARPDPSKRVEISDAGCAGLFLVVQPSGAKSWALRYRHAGRPTKLTLGRWPLMGLAAAREAAGAALEEVAHGCDPAAAKKAEKAARQDAALTERDKVKTLVEKFDTRHLSTLKSGAQARAFLDRFVVKAWGDRDIQTITKRDVVDLLDEIVDSGRGTTANRVLAHTKKFLNWAVERDIIAASPAAAVKPPVKEVSRDRVLSDDEVRWFWTACDVVGEPFGPMGKLLLLTGQRLNEVAQMTEDEVDGDVWRLPASRVKNGRAHDVPLSAAAQDVLAAKARVAGRGGYIFTTTGRSPVSGFDRAREAIAVEMAKAANEGRPEAADPVEIPHWTFHDLRRTLATNLARMGVALRVTEAVLNHVSGSGAGIVSVYQRHDFAEEKRSALEAWGRRVTELVEGKEADNVVQIAAAGARQ